jgi:hypothetical protein
MLKYLLLLLLLMVITINHSPPRLPPSPRYERLGLLNLALEAYVSIYHALCNAADPVLLHPPAPSDISGSSRSGDGDEKAEPFPATLQARGFSAWLKDAGVWRGRAEAYAQAGSYAIAAALYRKVKG